MKIIATGVVASAVALASVSYAGAHKAHQVKLATQMDKVSYTIGYDLGKNFHQQDIKATPTLVYAGLKAGFAGEKGALSEKQMQETMQAFQKEMMQKMMAKQKEVAAANEKKSVAYLSRMSHMKGVKQIEKGLYYKVLKAGKGPIPTKEDTVTVNYKGTLPDGKVFDSSYARKQPATFPVNGVIPGWTKALEKMPQGSTWMLYISPKLAYGKFAPPSIGANQALTFKVELLKVEKPKAHKADKAKK